MNLVIDIGNTQIKIAGFENDKQILFKSFSTDAIINAREYVLREIHSFDNLIISSVSKEDFLKKDQMPQGINYIDFSYKTPIPLKINYDTPETLGPDRLAAAVGAAEIFPEKNVLAIIAGTCITYEIISKKAEYLGGAISPGMSMRYKALNTFTGKLPLINKSPNYPLLTGKKTSDCISSGVVWGISAEIEGVVNEYKKLLNDIKIVFSGGDAFFFDRMLKSEIFVTENLVVYGLNKIILYNVNSQRP